MVELFCNIVNYTITPRRLVRQGVIFMLYYIYADDKNITHKHEPEMSPASYFSGSFLWVFIY